MSSKERVISGLIGSSLKHSVSPLIHNYWHEQLALNGTYSIYETSSKQLKATLDKLYTMGCRGINVTIPHKVDIMKHCHMLSATASRIGAVNSIIFSREGHIYGDNTDKNGFTSSLHGVIDANQVQRAILVGSGGASRAVGHSLLDYNYKSLESLLIVNRTASKAELLKTQIQQYAPHVNIEISSFAKLTQHIKEYQLLVNTTSLGMGVGGRGGGSGESSIEEEELIRSLAYMSKESLVVDIVYNPLRTRLLREAQRLGLRHLGGLWMLLYQGALSFTQWHGCVPPVTRQLYGLISKNLVVKN